MEWIEKEKSYNKSRFDAEIMVSLVKRSGKLNVCFKFRKNSFHKIVKNGESGMVVAKEGTRIYFKESNDIRGFKLRDWGLYSKYIIVTKKIVSDDEVGEYNLKFDSENMLCYIDTDCKLEKELTWFGKD